MPFLASVHLGAMIQQNPGGFDDPRARDGHQRRLAFGGNRVRIHPGFEQPFDHRGIRVLAG